MNKRTAILLAACAATLLTGCRVRDVRTTTIRAGGLHDETGLHAIEVALKALPDTRLTNARNDRRMCMEVLSFDPATGDVTIRYDSMKVGIKNLEEAISKAGFDTPSFPAARSEKRPAQNGG